MDGIIALLGAAGLLVAILANLTSIVGFLDDHLLRRRQHSPAGDAVVAAVQGSASVARAAPPTEQAGPRAATKARTPTIRTPDQRVRIFVSSTLHELAEERQRARAAIEHLRLTPVMFEMGARPHAPRDLYRAYLDQSDVFVAIYGRRYGWVAPGEPVSGLEDEYLRSGDRPKLVYVKRADGPREDALEGLLDRIRSDDRVSYRSFDDPDELGELLADDLAALLSERFDQGAGWANTAQAPIPVAWGPLIGREAEAARACALLDDASVRLVTIAGPGGIGKSRLALEVADRARHGRADGVAFVGLQSVRDPALVGEAIAGALGVHASGGRDLAAALKAFVSHRDMLLVLDNFEQVLDSAPLLSSLLEAAPRLKVLVTSRTLLRLSAERVVPLAPLRTALDTEGPPLARALASPAVELFMWRARALRPDLELTDANADVVLDIVRRLEGWPLAIVLAASRAGHLSLRQLLDRLSSRLDLLVGGARDMPDRQRTLRATIAWSLDLLPSDARLMLARASVFEGGFTLDALERLVRDLPWPSGAMPDLVDTLSLLVDGSLLSTVESPTGGRYVMLELVRECAAEQLGASADGEILRAAHAQTYLELVAAVSPLGAAGRSDWFAILSVEQANLRLAVQGAVASGDGATAAGFAELTWINWWMRLQAPEHLPWITAMLERPDLTDAQRVALHTGAAALHLQAPDVARSAAHLDRGEELLRPHGDPRRLATLEICRALAASFVGDAAATERHALRARDLAASCGFAWAESFAAVAMARVGVATGRLDEGIRWAEEGVRLTARSVDRQSEAWARLVLGVAQTLAGRLDAGLDRLREASSIFGSLGIPSGEAMVLRTMAFHATLAGDVERAARLAGAADCAQYHHGALGLEPEHTITTQGLERFRAGVSGERWRVAFDEGRAMPLDVAIRYAAAETGVAETSAVKPREDPRRR